MMRMIVARRQSGRPTINKLSRAEVDRIPLVLYIPPPPGEDPTSPTSPLTPLPRALSHPPVSPRPVPANASAPSKKRRFVFFHPTLKRRKTDANGQDLEHGWAPDSLPMSPTNDMDDWDQTFGPAPYPFVRLPENRATCGICLIEFEAPRRLNGRDKDAHPTSGSGSGEAEDEAHELNDIPHLGSQQQQQHEDGGVSHDSAQITEVRVESPRPADAGALQFADSDNSDAPEPLRLLSCGHVYHVSVSPGARFSRC